MKEVEATVHQVHSPSNLIGALLKFDVDLHSQLSPYVKRYVVNKLVEEEIAA